jgi:hypothetical protein
MSNKPDGFYSKKDRHGKLVVHPVFDRREGQRTPRAQIYRLEGKQQTVLLDGNVKGFTVKFRYKDGKTEEVHLIARDYEEALEGSLWKVSHEQGMKHDCKDVDEITIVDPDLGEILHKIGAGARTVATSAYRAGRGFVRGLPKVAYATGRVAGVPSAMRESYREGKEAGLPEDVQRAKVVARAYNIGASETRWDKGEILRLLDQARSNDVTVHAMAVGYLKRYYPEVYAELMQHPHHPRKLSTKPEHEGKGQMEGYGYQ